MSEVRDWREILNEVVSPSAPVIKETRFNSIVQSDSLRSLSFDDEPSSFGLFTYGLYTVVFSTLFEKKFLVERVPSVKLSEWLVQNNLDKAEIRQESELPVLPSIAKLIGCVISDSNGI